MTLSLSLVIKKIIFVFLIFSGLYFAKDFLMPLFIGGILATLFLPFCNWLERKRIAKGLAVFISFLGLLLVVIFIISLLGYKVTEIISDIAVIKQKSIAFGIQIQDYIFNHLNISIEEQYKIIKNEQPSYANLMQSILSSVTYLLTTIILVLVYFVFLLYYRNHIKIFILKLTSIEQRTSMETMIHDAANISQQYLLGLSKMIVLLWIMYSIGFSAIGVENAIFFAILCGLLEIIPFVGNITGTILTLLVAAIHGANLTLLGGIVVTYAIVQFIQGWILEPLILGPQVKINSLFTIIALVLGELIWGIPGIILAIPVTAMIKIVCDQVETLKPYGFLIGEIKMTKKDRGFFYTIKKAFSTKK